MKNPYAVLYADNDILIVNKKSGILATRDRYDESALHLDSLLENEFKTIFPVHRLDKETSGVMVFARTENAHRALSLQFQNHAVEKIYHCIVYGAPSWSEKKITLPLSVDFDSKHRTIANKNGKPSETFFRVLGKTGSYSWLLAKPKTGRTHQIRAHLASENIFIVCDTLYFENAKPIFLSKIKRKWRGNANDETPLISRMALHAFSISFLHPTKKERVTFSAPYEKDMKAFYNQCAKLFSLDFSEKQNVAEK